VEIVAGANTGQRTTTGTDGAYQFYNLQTGTFTLRFSKTGFVTTERTFTLTGSQFNSLDVTLAAS